MKSIQDRIRDAVEGIDGWYEDISFNNGGTAGYDGNECIAIVGKFSACMEMIGSLIKDAKREDRFEEIVDSLLNFETDFQGRESILYWPNLPPTEEEPEYEYEDQEFDGQPDEAQEWHDFDPDC